MSYQLLSGGLRVPLTFRPLLATIHLSMTQYITSTPGIIGGKPAIAGTRIPISRIVYLLSQGYTVDTIHGEYPWVKKQVIKGVIDEIVQLVNAIPDVTKVSQVQAAS
jgi:uncharacterized protein (DUF433 family)